jgi:hypothetical protein
MFCRKINDRGRFVRIRLKIRPKQYAGLEDLVPGCSQNTSFLIFFEINGFNHGVFSHEHFEPIRQQVVPSQSGQAN